MALSRESSPVAAFEPPSSPPPSSPPPLPSTFNRKRTRSPTLHDHSRSSSDCFLFSSDDAPEDVENYEIPNRKKRQYVGTWWAYEDKPTRSPMRSRKPRAKEKLSRNKDSGIWLSSDSSDDSALERLAAAPRPNLWSVPRPQQTQNSTELDNDAVVAYANEKVQTCVEEGKEMVDLSGIHLRSIPDEVIQPLAQLIKIPKVGTEVPKEDCYQSLTPSLKLFLSNNELRALPMSIWNLQHLTVLSLRNNKLTEIPTAIANLENLEELNLAGNKLRWLPWELLRLVAPRGKLASLTVSPNRFLQGAKLKGNLEFSDDIEEMIDRLSDRRAALDDPKNTAMREQIAWEMFLLEITIKRMESCTPVRSSSNERRPWKQEPVYITCSPVARMDFDGSWVKTSAPRPSHALLETTHLPTPGAGHTPAQELANIPNKTRVPSLFEQALRLAVKATSKPQSLYKLLPPDETPPWVADGLKEMERVAELGPGGQLCSVCGKEYILPMAEWVEFWHYAPDTLVCKADDSFLPFLRRACSLGCAAAVNGGEVQ